MNLRNSNGCIRCKIPRETLRPLHFPGAQSAAADFLPGSRRIGTRATGAAKVRSNCRRAAIAPLDCVGPPGQSPGSVYRPWSTDPFHLRLLGLYAGGAVDEHGHHPQHDADAD